MISLRGNLKILKKQMTKKFKVLGKYIKDLSSETPNIETYLFVRDNISKYKLDIDITSIPVTKISNLIKKLILKIYSIKSLNKIIIF